MKHLSLLLLTLFLSFPSFSAQLTIPGSPGGVVHRYARDISPFLDLALGEETTLDFKPGANGALGAKFFKDKKDESLSLFIANAQIWEATDVNPVRDMQVLAYMGTMPGVIFSLPNKKYSDFKELLTYSKKNKVSYAISSTAPSAKLFRRISQKYNPDLIEVGYKMGPEVVPAVMGGHVTVGITAVDTVLPLILKGEVTALAVFGFQRVDALALTPTLTELGITIPGQAMYYNNIFLWGNNSADGKKVKDFKRKLAEQMKTKEYLDVVDSLHIQFGVKNFNQSEFFLREILDQRR